MEQHDDKDPELEKAKADLAKAGKDLEKAEHEIEEAREEIEEAEQHHKKPKVEFEDVNSLETVDFRTPWDTKLTAAWNEAATLLKEPRKPTDRLQTPEGRDLMPNLELTMRELEEKKIITALKFQIVGPTGGA
jgi:multidrug resistance efflux pump